ncbi:FUSC family membrane protein [Streptomyces sp. NPDC006460]|uniref:FUSC family membrane protein n=1 Tax=Streptomyces sp. NPDC006460 TaxID=3154304 RepID=UPI0033A938F4
MSWLRALRKTARSGMAAERRRLEPLVAARGALGLALVVGGSLALFGPGVAASSAFGAFQAAIATFQRSWRPRPTLALASGASLAVSTFLGYLTGAGAHPGLFLALLVLWTFGAGLAWTAGPTVGIIASSNVAIMLVTVTLPTSVAEAAGHAAMIAVGGLVQAALVVLLPVRRWGAHRDALADALAAEADYARRLRQDPTAPFDPVPLMTARSAAAVTPRQARRRPAELHGARGLAERIRPVLASLADPAVGVPAEGTERGRVRELLGAAGAILDAAAHAIRHGEPVELPPAAVAALRTPDTHGILHGPPRRAAVRLAAFGMYLLMRTGYVVTQVCVSAYVVFLLGMGGSEWAQTVRERVILTLLGGVLAMLGYALYPAWETPRLRGRLADWLVADGRYAATVVAHYADPAGSVCPDVREALLATRAARIAWQEALVRATHEPVRHRGLSHAATEDAEHALAQFGRIVMLMEAHLPERGAPAVPAAATLAEALRRATERGAKVVRERGEPDWDDLRETVATWDAPPDPLLRTGARMLLEALDELSAALEPQSPQPA